MPTKKKSPLEIFAETTAHDLARFLIDSYNQQRHEAGAGPRPLDPYAVLGVDPGDPLTVVEAVYRAKSKVFHPDVQGTGNAERFKQIHAAYEAIIQGHPG